MFDVNSEIAPSDVLARFILRKDYIRSSDKSVKDVAFIPAADGALSVTRHGDQSETELWAKGKLVELEMHSTASPITIKLIARADANASAYTSNSLKVDPSPREAPARFENLYHADVIGWPLDKMDQKAITREIADQAVLIMSP